MSNPARMDLFDWMRWRLNQLVHSSRRDCGSNYPSLIIDNRVHVHYCTDPANPVGIEGETATRIRSVSWFQRMRHVEPTGMFLLRVTCDPFVVEVDGIERVANGFGCAGNGEKAQGSESVWALTFGDVGGPRHVRCEPQIDEIQL